MATLSVDHRPYEFQGSHYTSQEIATYVVCDCGWEKRIIDGRDTQSKIKIAMLEHRVDHLEGKVLTPEGEMTADLAELAREDAEALGFEVD